MKKGIIYTAKSIVLLILRYLTLIHVHLAYISSIENVFYTIYCYFFFSQLYHFLLKINEVCFALKREYINIKSQQGTKKHGCIHIFNRYLFLLKFFRQKHHSTKMLLSIYRRWIYQYFYKATLRILQLQLDYCGQL